MKKILYIIILLTCLTPMISLADSTAIPGGESVEITNPLATDGKNPSPQVLIGRVINATMGLVGSLALAMFIYGGFTWMLAAGNDQRVQKGKDILIWATIGLIVIFSSYALVRVIFTGLGVTE
jgi:hypothetical protein